MEEFAAALEARFADAGDFVRRVVPTPGGTVRCYWIDGLVNGEDLSAFVLRPLSRGGEICSAVTTPVPDPVTGAKQLLSGFCLVLGPEGALCCEVRSSVKRTPAPPEVESTVKGAKDAFTETLRINSGLVRSHLRSLDLRLEERSVGSACPVQVSVLSLEGRCDETQRARVLRRLETLQVESLASPAAVEEALSGSRRTAFPLLRYTERTDKFCQSLLDGRIGVLVDGQPLGYTLPVDLATLMCSPEDLGMDYLAASLVRMLRYLALAAALLLPGAFVAMMVFQPEMIPTKLLESIIESKQGVPFPATLEVLGLLIAFELLQEAGLHLPKAIGQTISIIGGLVVGTAAVEARILSPAALIVVSAAGICGFCLPSQDLADAVRVWRLGLCLCAAAGGLFGLTAGALALLIHLAGLESLGKPYLAPFCRAETGQALIRPLLDRSHRELP